MRIQEKTAILGTWIIAGILVTPLCGQWFSCGCDWPWGSLFWTCNAIVHNTPPPHCPWCTHPLAALLSIGGSLAAGTLAAWKGRVPPANDAVATLYRTGIGTATCVCALFLSGWLTALATAYPTFLGMGLY